MTCKSSIFHTSAMASRCAAFGVGAGEPQGYFDAASMVSG
jgi:hypothetical protein